MGSAGHRALQSAGALQQLQTDTRAQSFAEMAARLDAIGRLRLSSQSAKVVRFLEGLPLDAPRQLERANLKALDAVDSEKAARLILARLGQSIEAGFEASNEIEALGNLPAKEAAPALMQVAELPLKDWELNAFANACERIADPGLVEPLSRMLDPRQPNVRSSAISALLKIGTESAAKALRPHLKNEMDLGRKLDIAAFLGRHGIKDGYVYAIEHMSEPQHLERAVLALAAIRHTRCVDELKRILATSHDVNWQSAAIRALGALDERKMASVLLRHAAIFSNPLAPASILALADLQEEKAIPLVEKGLNSRNGRLVIASIRAAGKLQLLAKEKRETILKRLAGTAKDTELEERVRKHALEALVTLNYPQQDVVLASIIRERSLEGRHLLTRAEELVRKRKVNLKL